jgi:hypothetical protein
MVRHVNDPFKGEYGESGGFGSSYFNVPFNPPYDREDYIKKPEEDNEDQQNGKTKNLEDIDEDSPFKE